MFLFVPIGLMSDYVMFVVICILVFLVSHNKSLINNLGKYQPIKFLKDYQYQAFLNHALALMISKNLEAILCLGVLLVVIILVTAIYRLSRCVIMTICTKNSGKR